MDQEETDAVRRRVKEKMEKPRMRRRKAPQARSERGPTVLWVSEMATMAWLPNIMRELVASAELSAGALIVLGDSECIAVSDGAHTYAPPVFPPPPVFLFANTPRELLGQALGRHSLQLEQWQEWVSRYICLVINTGEHPVLVDAGANGLSQNTGKLVQNLKNGGIEPEDIDSVILTHGHPDHIDGNTDSEGKLAFPGETETSQQNPLYCSYACDH